MTSTTVLLGPQRLQPTLVTVFDELDLHESVAAVTAGWQEREAEVQEMQEHLGRPVVNLMLHERCESLFAADPKLAELYHQRQDRLRELQQIYRLRLSHAMQAARQVMDFDGPADLLDAERKAALQAIRVLDAHHLKRIGEVHADFEEKARLLERPALLRHRHELAKLLRGCEALAIAGGHVAVLLNRLRIFGILELAGKRPVIAWSAGAMCLGSRIVVFHDFPPQGAGDAEVLEEGLGLFEDVLPLPHGRRRLNLEDRTRVSLFARRFAPAIPTVLEPGARLTRRGTGGWRPGPGTDRLTTSGELRPMGVA